MVGMRAILFKNLEITAPSTAAPAHPPPVSQSGANKVPITFGMSQNRSTARGQVRKALSAPTSSARADTSSVQKRSVAGSDANWPTVCVVPVVCEFIHNRD